MTQEELAQLKTLLEKAQAVLPKAKDFQVWEHNGFFQLYGSKTTTYTGGLEEWLVTAHGIEVSGESIY